MKKVIWFILILILSQPEYGCSGCSPSGRRSHQNSIRYKTSSTHNIEGQNSKNRHLEVKKSSTKLRLPLNELYNRYKNSVFLIYTSNGKDNFQGSGFFISKNGLAISNYHVFEDTYKNLDFIKTINGKRLKVEKVIEKSKEYDYIIFLINVMDFKIRNPFPIASKRPEIGEEVFAIGNPRGLEGTLSKGIISAYRENGKLIQTTTEITHGSSGGPLINMYGQVVGITTAGLGEANLNFAVNIRLLNLGRFKLN